MVNSKRSHLLPHILNHGKPDHDIPMLNMPSDDYRQHKIHWKWSLIQKTDNVKMYCYFALWNCFQKATRTVKKALFSLAQAKRLSLRMRIGYATWPLCDIAEHHNDPTVKKQGHKLEITNKHPVKVWEHCNSRRAKCNRTAHVHLLVSSKHADKHSFPLSGTQEQIKHGTNSELN